MLRSNMRNLTSYKPNNFVNCGIGRENETVQKKKKPITRFLSRRGCSYAPAMVPLVGLEPTRYRYHRILSPARLPISPQRQMRLLNYIITTASNLQ